MLRFKCLKCGKCCKMSPISLLPHEKIILENLSKRLGIEVSFSYDYYIHDARHNYNIVLTYHLNLEDGKCPFLSSDSKCLLQNYYKPLVCRAFPYIPSKVEYVYDTRIKVLGCKTSYAISTACTYISKLKDKLSTKIKSPYEIRKFMLEEFSAAAEMELKRRLVLSYISFLWKRGALNLTFSNSPGIPINAFSLIRKYFPYIHIKL